jgi:hypothetical protein
MAWRISRRVFAKLKALLRDAAARTIEALWAALGRLLGRFPPAECARYLANSGYGQSSDFASAWSRGGADDW